MSTADKTATQRLREIFTKNIQGDRVGVYAVCAAHPLVLEAAFIQAKKDDSILLIESTANQVNQFGGYTGMTPADFPVYVEKIAQKVGFNTNNLMLGGDHLGPLCWTNESAQAAMAKSIQLIHDYVAAGFNKIHLDTSMLCADDSEPLSDELVAHRSATLCAAAEAAAGEKPAADRPVYVIGTEVPEPGGATDDIELLSVTSAAAAQRTIAAHESAFMAAGLSDAWKRVVAVVVQPGVEFNHNSVHDYIPEAAKELSSSIDSMRGLVYEAHSSDYQPPSAYTHLIDDHFAILKVGPQLTFALREALFGLATIAGEMFNTPIEDRLPAICEEVMRAEPTNWVQHYPSGDQNHWYLHYSFSDRIRYYWPHPTIEAAVERLFDSLSSIEIPMPLLSQYLPYQYEAIRSQQLEALPRQLVLHHVMRVTQTYSGPCNAQT